MAQEKTLAELLKENRYPGRGIVLGRSWDADSSVIVYFIMGRSINSRNRVFTADGAGLRTQAHDPAKLADPSLVIYSPVRVYQDTTIVTNGDQTDTIYDALSQGGTFEEALRTRTFEPDGPIFTPRISGILRGFDYRLSILKSVAGDPVRAERFFFEYVDAVPGVGHFLHTYRCDGDPVVPSFEGEPVRVALPGTIDSLTDEIWNALDPENKVSLFVRFLPREGTPETRIVNKNQGPGGAA